MYSKEESARLRQQFWISFGQYMKPVPSASGSTVNWTNYKTGVKNIFFKMDVDKKTCFYRHPAFAPRSRYQTFNIRAV